jgi:pyridinium-3,5-biscarboxylic acid mononucleotide synthase
MDDIALTQLLQQVKLGKTPIAQAVGRLKDLPFADLGYATVDTHRQLRTGVPEVVLGQWKTVDHTLGIVEALVGRKQPVLVTRLQPEKGEALKAHFPQGHWHPVARIFEVRQARRPKAGKVMEEAAITAEACGATVTRITDVGVAGIHRLLKRRAEIQACDAAIAVAGMEGALGAALGGLVGIPVIAVPTSIGYGASFHGVAALLSMLSACASNVVCVNIDNGFGAGFYAALITRKGKGRR